MPGVRLQKALADAGVASRRAAESMIAAGRVTVDGVSAGPGTVVDPERQSIEVDGQPLPARARPVYLALHKPRGVTSTVADRHAASTVVDLLPPDVVTAARRLYPVGRLDRDSEGLLLMTNDGDWSQRVLHPSHGVDREYAVGLREPLRAEQAWALIDGIDLEEGRAMLAALRPATRTETAALLEVLGADAPSDLSWYRATLRQGWKRQVRRMFAAVEAPVARLVRVRIGTVRLGGLRPGQVRRLAPAEAARLVAATSLSRPRRPASGHGGRGGRGAVEGAGAAAPDYAVRRR